MKESHSIRVIALSLWFAVVACGGDGQEQGPRGAGTRESAPAVTVELRPASDPAAGTVVIRGSVRFEGEPPPQRPLAISGMTGCTHEGPAPLTETVVVSEGRLANAIVFVSRGVPADGLPAVPAEAVRLDQQGCIYRPHVTALRVGQELRVTNSDPTSHNVHVYAQRTSVPNRTQAPGGQDLRIVFEAAEQPVKVGCDIHPWMGAWIGVFDHPFFAVTGPGGEFEIGGLPPGKYTLGVWHESLGRGAAELDLSAGGSAEVDFAYSS